MSSCNEPVNIRPHHGLCIAFFEGKGYSADFTANMTKVISKLKSNDPIIKIAAGADVICGSCPHSLDGVCESIENVERYDRGVLKLCGFSAGDELHWSEFSGTVFRSIISAGKTAEVCGGCSWRYICADKADKMTSLNNI